MIKCPGTFDSFSQEQAVTISELQRYVREELGYNHPEINFWFLLRFGRARNFNLSHMKIMIKGYVDYRRDISKRGIDRINFYEKCEPIFKYFDGGFFYTDKEDRPVYYLFFGKCDFANLFKHYSVEQVIDAHINLIERFVHVILPACSHHAKKRIETSVTIVDMKNLAFLSLTKGPVREFGERLTQIAQNYFPETLGKLFFVNVPIFFSLIWKIVKPWLNEHTRKRITILSSNGHKELAQVIDPEKIHVAFGGKNTEDYRLSPGPWSEALHQSFKECSFYSPNYQDSLYQYYYTDEEKRLFEKAQKSTSKLEEFSKNEFQENCLPQKVRFFTPRVSLREEKECPSDVVFPFSGNPLDQR